MIGSLRKYLNNPKQYVVEIMLSEKQETRYGDVMDVNVEVSYQSGGHVLQDCWCEAYCSINEFKKRYDLKNAIVWRFKENG